MLAKKTLFFNMKLYWTLPRYLRDMRITSTVSSTKRFHHPLNLLSLTGHAEKSLEPPQCQVNRHCGKINLIGKMFEAGHGEGTLEIGQVLSNHLLTQTLPRYEEPRDGGSRALEELLLDQIRDPSLGLLVEEVEPDPVETFSNDLTLSIRELEAGFDLGRHRRRRSITRNEDEGGGGGCGN